MPFFVPTYKSTNRRRYTRPFSRHAQTARGRFRRCATRRDSPSRGGQQRCAAHSAINPGCHYTAPGQRTDGTGAWNCLSAVARIIVLDRRRQRRPGRQGQADTPQKYDWHAHGPLGNVGHVIARVGNIAGDILDPRASALVPSDLWNERKQTADKADIQQKTENAQTAGRELDTVNNERATRDFDQRNMTRGLQSAPHRHDSPRRRLRRSPTRCALLSTGLPEAALSPTKRKLRLRCWFRRRSSFNSRRLTGYRLTALHSEGYQIPNRRKFRKNRITFHTHPEKRPSKPSGAAYPWTTLLRPASLADTGLRLRYAR
jgi:hypothetical protein